MILLLKIGDTHMKAGKIVIQLRINTFYPGMPLHSSMPPALLTAISIFHFQITIVLYLLPVVPSALSADDYRSMCRL